MAPTKMNFNDDLKINSILSDKKLFVYYTVSFVKIFLFIRKRIESILLSMEEDHILMYAGVERKNSIVEFLKSIERCKEEVEADVDHDDDDDDDEKKGEEVEEEEGKEKEKNNFFSYEISRHKAKTTITTGKLTRQKESKKFLVRFIMNVHILKLEDTLLQGIKLNAYLYEYLIFPSLLFKAYIATCWAMFVQ